MDLESALEHCPTAVTWLDHEGRHLYVNHAAAEMLGRPREAILQRRLCEIGFSEPTTKLWWKRLADVLQSNTAADFVDPLDDGELVQRWVPAEDRTVLVYAHVRQRRREAPRAHASREALAIKVASIGIWDWELATDRTMWNAEMLRIYGVRPEDFTGRGSDYIAFTREDYRERQREAIARSIERGVTEDMALAREATFDPKELCIVAADGQERFTLGDSITIVDVNGRPVRMLGVTIDVTERHRTERMRDELEERFTKAFRYNPAAMNIARLDGPIIEANERFAAMIGVSAEEVRGHDMRDLGIGLEMPNRPELLERLRATGSVRDEPFRFRLRNGEMRDVVLSAELITIGGERHVLTFLSDLTEFHALQAKLIEAHKLEAVGRLAGGVAHDFNNLLSVIRAATEGRDLASILTATDRASDLTRQLLAFGRQQVLHATVLDLAALVRAFEPLLAQAVGPGIAVEIRATAEPALVRVDRAQIEQVLMNLVVNARDAMPGGRVLVEVARAGAQVTLAVQDSGLGITPEVRARMFDPFFTTKGQGTGLGLATVHGIVEQSGGTIEVESALGRGTRLVVRLPRVEAEAPAPTRTVLLVEDHPAVRKVTTHILVHAGFHVREATSAERALALLDDGEPVDIVLTDLRLPVMNGRKLASAVRARLPGLPVLIMSGHFGDGFVKKNGLEPGIDFLEKPFAAEELVRRLTALLDARKDPGAPVGAL